MLHQISDLREVRQLAVSDCSISHRAIDELQAGFTAWWRINHGCVIYSFTYKHQTCLVEYDTADRVPGDRIWYVSDLQETISRWITKYATDIKVSAIAVPPVVETGLEVVSLTCNLKQRLIVELQKISSSDPRFLLTLGSPHSDLPRLLTIVG